MRSRPTGESGAVAAANQRTAEESVSDHSLPPRDWLARGLRGRRSRVGVPRTAESGRECCVLLRCQISRKVFHISLTHTNTACGSTAAPLVTTIIFSPSSSLSSSASAAKWGRPLSEGGGLTSCPHLTALRFNGQCEARSKIDVTTPPPNRISTSS